MRVCIHGKTYPDVKTAAAALGVCPDTVYSALSRGNLNTCGQGKGNRTVKRGGIPKKPITIHGRHFESIADLAKFIGRCKRSVRHSVANGTAASMTRIHEAVLKKLWEEDVLTLKQRQEASKLEE